MAENNINAHCDICGKGYHVCQSCLDMKTIKPWRTVTDAIEHYKVYLAIHGYTITKNKDVAKEELKKCNISDIECFLPGIKSVIKEIMDEPKKEKNVVKKDADTKASFKQIKEKAQ